MVWNLVTTESFKSNLAVAQNAPYGHSRHDYCWEIWNPSPAKAIDYAMTGYVHGPVCCMHHRI